MAKVYKFDRRYRSRAIPLDAVSHVGRMSTVFPLAVRQGQQPNWNRCLTKIQGMWRGLVAQLAANGIIYKHMQWVRNCQPANIFVKQAEGDRVFFCDHHTVCPWCHARFIEPCLRNGLTSWRAGYGLHLAVDYKFHLYHELPTDALRDELVRRKEEASRLCLANDCDTLGSFFMVFAEPSLQKGKEGCWRVGSRVLSFLKPGGKMMLTRGWKTLQHDNPTQNELYGCLSAATRYAVGIMKGDAQMVAEILKARAKLRLFERTGCFRKPMGSAFAQGATP